MDNKNKKKKFLKKFFSKYKYNYSSGYSASNEWAERFFNFSWKSFSDQEKYQKILQEVFRSANLIPLHDAKGEERTLTVQWSNGTDQNKLESNEIFLSPDVVNINTCKCPKWTQDQLTDVLIGQTLTEAALKTEASIVAQNYVEKIPEKEERELTQTLWYAAEVINAREQVLKNYPGFAGYFAANLQYYTNPKEKEILKQKLETNSADSNIQVEALLWNFLHPTETIEVAEKTKDAIDRLLAAGTSKKRATTAHQIIQEFFDSQDKSKKKQPFKVPVDELGLDRFKFGQGINNLTDPKLKQDPNATPVHNCFDPKQQTYVSKVPFDAKLVQMYQKKVVQLKSQIRNLRDRLKIRNENLTITEHGLSRGFIDEGSIFKLGFTKLGYQDPRIFEDFEIPRGKDIAIGLLIDESGSMGGNRINIAKDLAIILYNALKDLPGINFTVVGHTGELDGYNYNKHYEKIGWDKMWIRHFITPEQNQPETLMELNGISENLDGFAIDNFANSLSTWYPNIEHRILFHFSDGEPVSRQYAGYPAMEHVQKVCKLHRSKGIQIFGIGIDGAFSKSNGDLMYGPNNYILIDSSYSIPIVSNLITKAIKIATKQY